MAVVRQEIIRACDFGRDGENWIDLRCNLEIASNDLVDLGMKEKLGIKITITFLAIVHCRRNKFRWGFIL